MLDCLDMTTGGASVEKVVKHCLRAIEEIMVTIACLDIESKGVCEKVGKEYRLKNLLGCYRDA